MRTYLYFQPEFVDDFVCDGLKCSDNCCERTWSVIVDDETFERYKRIRPAEKAREVIACLAYDVDNEKRFIKDRPCPFLTDKKLCRLQLEYGESFLSETCATYPRRSLDFGKFLERSLVMSCPIAAELILFRDEPIKFEFVEVSEPAHSHDGKLIISPVYTEKNFATRMLELQVAMISILQERTLTIDQRLIVLGFFLDRLKEIKPVDDEALMKLTAAYESKSFLSEYVPGMLASIHFNEKNFFALMLKILESLHNDFNFGAQKKILGLLFKTYDIVPDANGKISAADFAGFAEARKYFLTRRTLIPENFLVNELFTSCYPWRYGKEITKNFGIFVATYKLFELIAFALEQQNLADKENLSLFTGRLLCLMDHTEPFVKKILNFVPEDIFDSLETMLEP